MAAQAVLILIDRGVEHSDAIGGADPRDALLRDANQWRRGKDANRHGAVRIVAVHTGGVTIVVGYRRLSLIVRTR